eukprot:jgi/Botrbrau1/20361/Bobra.0006s0026.1
MIAIIMRSTVLRQLAAQLVSCPSWQSVCFQVAGSLLITKLHTHERLNEQMNYLYTRPYKSTRCSCQPTNLLISSIPYDLYTTPPMP